MSEGLLELGEVLLASSQRRLEAVSRNVANATTPGYKAELEFESALGAAGANAPAAATDFRPGPLQSTGGRFDLAISGPGFFQVRAGDQLFYSRTGAFERDGEGRLVDASGSVLQSIDGGDVTLAADAEILPDGVIVEQGAPIGRIGVFTPDPDAPLRRVSGTYFSAAAMSPVQHPHLQRGMLEGANVELAGEMLGMMAAVRSAEVGARIVQTYDTLIGQAISTFSRGQR